MEFCFIDNNRPLDPVARRRVRSHALKGKNLGKTISGRGHRRRQCEKAPDGAYSEQQRFKEVIHGKDGRALLPKPSKHSFDAAWTNSQLSNDTYFRGKELSYFVPPESLTSSSQYFMLQCELSLSE